MAWTTLSRRLAPHRHPEEQPSHTGGRTTYWSTNNQDQSTFYAEAPAGNKHAARLRQIALESQPEYVEAEKTVPKKRLKGKSLRRLTGQEGKAVQRPPNSPGSSSLTIQRRSREDTGDGRQQACCPCSDHSPIQENCRSGRGTFPEAKMPPATVYRYESDGHITYHKKAPGAN